MENNLRKIIRETLSEIESKSMSLINEDCSISEDLRYHLDGGLGLCETIFRYGSDKHIDLINEVRRLYSSGAIQLSEDDLFVISTDAGEKAIFEGREVVLDLPFIDHEDLNEVKHKGKDVDLNKPFRTPSGPKKFAVYVKGKNGNIKKVTFGDPNLKIKNYDPKASKSFRARHKCSEKKDRETAGYWSCNVGRYADLLGLVSKNAW